MNDDNDGVVKCQKKSTTPPRCHSDQVDPLVPTELTYTAPPSLSINTHFPKRGIDNKLVRIQTQLTKSICYTNHQYKCQMKAYPML